MMVRGIRGAITVEKNGAEEIISATEELLAEMIRLNQVSAGDVASVLITTTEDLDAAFPAKAARSFEGWTYVPLMCAREIPVPGSLPRCIRVMMHVNTTRSQREVEHVFLRDAVRLRPDLANR
ncbi:chorismate mutase [Brevibacillus humidisoli]|uniref:chorismate mutase n=1 Tax=Brevibacillus humidisoli TaxID=2895522 RepID=UPI001E4498F3|nr:chorismate mutase [Brevibacillus humidisoli]UFJ42776.1 chorismate mutase [Brevibacillus humidisoli]